MQRLGSLLLVTSCVLATCAFTGVASAQDETPPLGEFNILRYYPAPGPGNYAQVDGAAVRGDPEFAAGLQLYYAHEPLRLYRARCDADGGNCETTGESWMLSRYVAAAPLWFSVALFHRLQISVIVPLAFTEGDPFIDPDPDAMGATLLRGGSGFAIADPRLHLKGNILDDHASGFRLGVSAYRKIIGVIS